MASIRVHTAQNVTLEYEVASLGERIVAAIIDNLILVAWAVAWVIAFTLLKVDGKWQVGLLLLLAGVPYVFYHLACEMWFNGQSLGKKARDIKVMRLDGTAPHLGDYLLRWLLRIVDTGIGGGLIAIVSIAAGGRGQRLGDMAAGTTVVSIRPRPQQATPLAPALGELSSYHVVFAQAALLSDHDVALIRQLAQQASNRGNFEALNEVANKVKSITGIHTDLPDVAFLQTVLKDHAHLAQQ